MKTVPVALPVVLLVALATQTTFADTFGHDQQLNFKTTKWKQVFNQLFYWNISKFATNNPQYTPAIVAEHSLYYSPNDFNQSYNAILGKLPNGGYSVKSSGEYRDSIANALGFDVNSCYLDESAPKYKGNETLAAIQNISIPAAGDLSPQALAKALWGAHKNRYSYQKNYFQTAEGQLAARALTDVIFVVIPGFGSHTIPDYTYPEIVEESNLAHGRAQVRHVGEGTGPSGEKFVTYDVGQSPSEFYANGPELRSPTVGAPTVGFDIVHPMGRELGNTMGDDDHVADALANFLRCTDQTPPELRKGCLPDSYSKKKLVLLGYSKGTPVAHNMVARYPDLRARTLAIVTIAGVNQGALPAESGFRGFVKATNSQTPPEAIAKVRAGEIAANNLPPKLEAMLALGAGANVVQQFFGSGAVSKGMVAAKLNAQVNMEQIREGIEGIYDMTQYQRIKWNLIHLNDAVFDQKLNVFDLSVITNREDFGSPDGGSNEGQPIPATFFPQFKLTTSDAQVNWWYMSKDNAFLIATSLDGFASSPGGLFDTQVAWTDTKAMPLDNRSIWETLHYTPRANSKQPQVELDTESASLREIQSLADEVNAARAVIRLEHGLTEAEFPSLPAGFEKMPRSQLIAKLGKMSNLNFVDLGDLRGTHWDTAFREVYKPDGEKDYYTHTFPRKAMLSALIETMAIYKSGLATQEVSRVQ